MIDHGRIVRAAKPRVAITVSYLFLIGWLLVTLFPIFWMVSTSFKPPLGWNRWLGNMYAQGHGAPRDDGEAIKWWRQAAEQRHVLAQDSLGLHYAEGVGVPQDLVQAYMWLDLVAMQGHEFSMAGRRALEERMTLTQIHEAKNMMYRWLKSHPQ